MIGGVNSEKHGPQHEQQGRSGEVAAPRPKWQGGGREEERCEGKLKHWISPEARFRPGPFVIPRLFVDLVNGPACAGANHCAANCTDGTCKSTQHRAKPGAVKHGVTQRATRYRARNCGVAAVSSCHKTDFEIGQFAHFISLWKLMKADVSTTGDTDPSTFRQRLIQEQATLRLKPSARAYPTHTHPSQPAKTKRPPEGGLSQQQASARLSRPSRSPAACGSAHRPRRSRSCSSPAARSRCW